MLAFVRRVKCFNPECGVWFNTRHPRKKYHTQLCGQQHSRSLREAMYQRHYKMSQSSFQKRKADPTYRPKRRRPKLAGSLRQVTFSLPTVVWERMRRYPKVNWSMVMEEYVLRELDRLDNT